MNGAPLADALDALILPKTGMASTKGQDLEAAGDRLSGPRVRPLAGELV